MNDVNYSGEKREFYHEIRRNKWIIFTFYRSYKEVMRDMPVIRAKNVILITKYVGING